MKITLIQHDIEWANPEKTRQIVDEAISRNPGSDLYVMPEMFTTGFLPEPQGLAECANSESLRWMQRKASEMDAALCGSMSVEDGGKYYNRMYFVKPDGETTIYDKSHLFIYSGEGVNYSAGDKRVIVEFRGVNILLEICYDLRFPMWSRNSVDADGHALYDLIIYSANWPIARRTAWDVLTRARAIENQCYVAACNRIGADSCGECFGGSKIIHPYGHLLTEETINQAAELTAEIDLAQLNRYRTKFPTLNDIIWTKDFC
ncbi:MAG: nitrilase family protein [Prevotellaceae bacterium]|nr:nitrilase family protein [Candidatus Colivivens caballi]